MIKEVIKASTGKKGEDNYKEFDEKVDMPENLDEAVENFGAEEVFNSWKQAHVVRLQGNLRKPEGQKTAKTVEVYARLVPLIEAGAMDEAQARAASGYHGPWPVV